MELEIGDVVVETASDVRDVVSDEFPGTEERS
jgi:hypothetical protein